MGGVRTERIAYAGQVLILQWQRARRSVLSSLTTKKKLDSLTTYRSIELCVCMTLAGRSSGSFWGAYLETEILPSVHAIKDRGLAMALVIRFKYLILV